VDAQELGGRFEALLKRLFEAEGFLVAREAQVGPAEQRADLLITSPSSHLRAIIEAKLYRSEQVGRGLLLNAARLTEALRSLAGADRGILAVTCRVDPLLQTELRTVPNLILYDYDVLTGLLSQYKDLATEFDSILDEAYVYRAGPRPVAIATDIPPLKDLLLLQVTPRSSDVQAERRGRELCAALKAIPAGKRRASDFEKECQQCLEYAFKEDLTDWRKQETTSTGLHRFDAVAKIRSKNDFWMALVRDFRTRYVVFEFKNYGEKIAQGQIHTTEKYLYPVALRGTAVIVSRKGPDGNAEATARGALRETGKLILNITVEDLCKIVDLRDDGKDPSDVFSELMDQMLLHMER
jgi:hypothetical protein